MNQQKVAIVTGASRGIGYATAKALCDSGFKVMICSTNEEQALKAAKELGPNALGIKADVSKEEDCQKLFDQTEQRLGKVTFLVNNAGIGFERALAQTTPDEISHMIDVNVKGMLYCCRQGALRMQEGAIVNISSFYGRTSAANNSVYCATKFAVNGLSQSLAAELYPKIKVFIVAPTSTDTKMLREDFGYSGKADKPEKIAAIVLDFALNYKERDTGSTVELWKLK